MKLLNTHNTEYKLFKIYKTCIERLEYIRKHSYGEFDSNLFLLIKHNAFLLQGLHIDLINSNLCFRLSYVIANMNSSSYDKEHFAEDANSSYLYAFFTQHPFPLGEPAISKDPVCSYFYAQNLLHGPFPEGEPAIAKRGSYALSYAKNALKGPFPLAEPIIANNVYFSYHYAVGVLDSRFILGEKHMKLNPSHVYSSLYLIHFDIELDDLIC